MTAARRRWCSRSDDSAWAERYDPQGGGDRDHGRCEVHRHERRERSSAVRGSQIAVASVQTKFVA